MLAAAKTYGAARNRADGFLTLSSGDLIEAPRDSKLTFRYGNELASSHSFDALAFEVNEEELLYDEDIRTLELWSDPKVSSRPVVLPVTQPEVIGREKVRVTVDIPPGVHVVSVAVSAPEEDARYNFRVLVG